LRQKTGMVLGLCLGSFLILTFAFVLGNLVSGKEPSNLPSLESLPVIASEEISFGAESGGLKLQGGDYFVNYRLQREASRQELKNMLTPLLNSEVEKTREEAQLKWLNLCNKIEKEDQIENLLKISGMKDAIADIGSNEVAVIVYASQLGEAEIKLISDIVVRVTDYPKEQIRIAYRY